MPTPRIRLSSCVLALLCGSGFVASDALGAKPTPAPLVRKGSVEAHRALLRSLLDQGPTSHAELLRAPLSSVPGLGALDRYMAELDPGKPLVLGESGTDKLTVRDGKLSVLAKGGSARKALADDLVRFGLRTPGDLQRAVEQRVLGLAEGRSGMDLKQASRLLRQRVESVRYLASTMAPRRFAMSNRFDDFEAAPGDLDLLDQHASWTPLQPGEGVALVSAPNVGTLRVENRRFFMDRSGVRRKPVEGVDEDVVTAADLLQLGVRGEADLRRLTSTKILEAAGVRGNPTEAATIARARAVLRAELDGESKLTPLLDGFADHDDVRLLRQAQRKIGRIEGKSLGAITIATDKGAELAFGKWGTVAKERLIVVYRPSGDRRDATVADLRRFGLGTKPALDARLEELVLKIAPEDLR